MVCSSSSDAFIYIYLRQNSVVVAVFLSEMVTRDYICHFIQNVFVDPLRVLLTHLLQPLTALYLLY